MAVVIDKPGLSPTGSLELYLDPHYVSDVAWRTQTVLLALLTAVLAAVVARSRSLLRRQVTDHLGRASLARYFWPNVVDALASAGEAGMAARRHPVAVLFADIRGFTRLSEALGPEATIELLTEFHKLVSRIVFEHRGTLEKYIGDAVMPDTADPLHRQRQVCRVSEPYLNSDLLEAIGARYDSTADLVAGFQRDGRLTFHDPVAKLVAIRLGAGRTTCSA